MHPRVKRALIGLSVAALGASLLGAAAPAYADEPASVVEPPSDEAHAAAEYRTIVHDVGLVETPRRGAPVVAQLKTGMPVTALCAFFLDGVDWVKIQHTAQFGFVPNSAVGGAGDLPYTCPSEVEDIEVLVFNREFRGGELGVPIEAWRCPSSRPFLVNTRFHKDDPFVPQGIRIRGWDAGIHTILGGVMQQQVQHNKKSYAAGFSATTISNWGLAQLGQVYVTCTPNVDKAYEAN